MQPTRRELLAGAGAGLATGLAGCSGQLTAEGAAFGAAEVSLAASVQGETGYSHHRTEDLTVTREFSRFGFSRSVEVTNVVSEYDKAIDLSLLGQRVRAAVFAALSTPQVSVLGKSFNPVAEMSTREIAGMLQEHYENVNGIREEASFESTVAGETTSVTRFTAAATLVELGISVDLYLYVSEAVELDGDFVVGLAAHPQAFGEQRNTVEALLAGVRRE